MTDEEIIECMARAAYHSVTGYGKYNTADYEEPDHWPDILLSVDADGFRDAARAALAAYRECESAK